MKKNDYNLTDELLPEYDMKELLKNGVRGKYAKRYKEGTNVVLLDPDVYKFFPNSEKVNEALRSLIQKSDLQEKIPTTA